MTVDETDEWYSLIYPAFKGKQLRILEWTQELHTFCHLVWYRDELNHNWKTQRRRRNVCAIFQAYFAICGHASTDFFHFAVKIDLWDLCKLKGWSNHAFGWYFRLFWVFVCAILYDFRTMEKNKFLSNYSSSSSPSLCPSFPNLPLIPGHTSSWIHHSKQLYSLRHHLSSFTFSSRLGYLSHSHLYWAYPILAGVFLHDDQSSQYSHHHRVYSSIIAVVFFDHSNCIPPS